MATYYQLPAANGNGLKLQKYDNEILMDAPGVNVKDALEYCKTFPYQPADILLCTAPKCGSHWMTNMLWKLKTLSDYKRPKVTIHVMEMVEKELYKIQEAPRILQTHLRPSHLPIEHLEKNGKIVLMLRNPKDACVSFYFHMKDAVALGNGQTFDEFFDSYFKGEMMFASYIQYLKEWDDILDNKFKGDNLINVEVFYYEEFKTNPMENLKRLNEYLGFNRDQGYLDKVLEQTSFDSMKHAEMKNKEKSHVFTLDTEGKTVIYRRGQVGDWKNHFTVAQSEAMDDLIKQNLTKGNIKFQYTI